MSEYIMNHTGEQLDEAIDKVLNGYIKPEGTLNITEEDNNTEVDVTRYALAKVQIPIPTFKTKELTISPSESDIVKEAVLDLVDGYSKVVVSQISSTYIGSGVPTKGAETFTPKKDVQQVIPKGRFLSGDQIIDKIPDNFIDKSKTVHFADITIDSITTGYCTVSGITDKKTGEVFTPKGMFAIACPKTTQNYSSGSGKPATMAIYCDFSSGESSAVAIYNTAFQGRIHITAAKDRLTVNGNSITYKESDPSTPISMYGLINLRWRWFVWG